jgi:hypothetical protein
VARLHSLTRDIDRVSATLEIGATTHVLSYRVVDGEPWEGYEPFVTSALPIAMRTASDLVVDGPVSPRLVHGLGGVQEMMSGWYSDFTRVDIRTAGPAARRLADSRGTACFFSAGLDSFYSVLKNREQLDALIFIHGFDVLLEDADLRERVAGLARRAARALDLELVELETDIKKISRRYCRWGDHYHGAVLASAGLLLADRFERVLIPASAPATLPHPWGSHPDLDHLWSSDAVEFVHDGAVTRAVKIALVKDSPVALENLRVCFQTQTGELNCGRCEKCLRTMVGLRIEGALERCSTLPDEVSLDVLARTPIPTDFLLARASENMAAAEAAGDVELAAALRQMMQDGPRRAAKLEARKQRRRAVERRLRAVRRRGRRLRRWTRRRRRRTRRALGRIRRRLPV